MWNELTILRNNLTIGWNDLTMERNDRIPETFYKGGKRCLMKQVPHNFIQISRA